MALSITVSHEQPFAVSVFACEEDTSLILSTDARVQFLEGHPIRVMTALIEDLVFAPGTVLPRRGSPVRLFAVVHDLEREPSTCDEWISQALNSVLLFCRKHAVVSLGLGPLGAVHGKRSTTSFIEALKRQLCTEPVPALRNVWIRTSLGTRDG